MRGVRFDPERAEVRHLVRRVPLRGARLLEIGCGDGRLSRRLAPHVRSVVGIDPDEAQIERARAFTRAQMRRRLRFVVGSAQRLPVRGRFDVALLSWSL